MKNLQYLYILLLLITTIIHGQNLDKKLNLIDLRLEDNDIKLKTLCQDESGYIWIASNKGLIRYDGLNSILYSQKTNETNIQTTGFSCISIYDNKSLLLAGNNKGLWEFCIKTDKLRLLNQFKNTIILDIAKSQNNQTFILTDKGIYQLINHGLIRYYPAFKVLLDKKNLSGSIAIDSENIIWFTLNGTLYNLNISTKSITKALNGKLPGDLTKVQIIDKQKICAGSYSNGIYIIDTKNSIVTNYKRPYYKSISIGSNSITALYVDKHKNCWIGSNYSLIETDKSFINQNGHYIMNELLIDNRINFIYIDKNYVVWVITNESELRRIIPKRKVFTQYLPKKDQDLSLIDRKVNAFYQDKNGNIWIGTRSGISGFNPVTKKFFHIRQTQSDRMKMDEVSSFFEISRDSLLISTWNRLYAFSVHDFSKQSWSHYKNSTEQQNVLGSIVKHGKSVYQATFDEGLLKVPIYKLARNEKLTDIKQINLLRKKSFYTALLDKENNLWLSDYKNGLDVLNLNTNIYRSYKHGNDSSSISDNLVYTIFQDKSGRIWIGTKNGLNLYNRNKKSFTRYYPEEWSNNNTIKAITEDKYGHIWFSQENRITRFIPDKKQFTYFKLEDWIPNCTFQGSSAFCDNSGILYFGTLSDGFITVNSTELTLQPNPNISLSGLIINDQRIIVGEKYKNKVLLPQNMNAIKNLSLDYNAKKIVIELSLLPNSENTDHTFAYRFDTPNSGWIYTKNNTLTLYNLSPGSYKLLVKGADNMGTWSKSSRTINIHIQTPPWKTWWAITFYIFVLIGIILLIVNEYLKKLKLSHELSIERFEKEQIKITDKQKVQFFTNISHEFRTPVTLISNYIRKIIANSTPKDKHYKELNWVNQNSEQLLLLVNQLLDFRKLEENQLKLKLEKNDIVSYCFQTYSQFETMAATKNIKYQFETSIDSISIWFDSYILDRILFNLLSNAFKYTDDGESIKLSIGISAHQNVMIQVHDTGIGIDQKEQKRIFDQFYQSTETKNASGTGIGLSFSKQMAELHKGIVSVESIKGKGSTFTLSIPFDNGVYNANDFLSSNSNTLLEPKNQSFTQNNFFSQNAELFKILVIEDNFDLRRMIVNELIKSFVVIEAENGQQGVEQALKHFPELIISDVQMPVMNGFEMCRILKQDVNTSHIPIILLTAKVLTENKLEGYKSGADDYIEKPFSLEILMLKISNILETQWKFRAFFGSGKVQIQQGLNSALDNEFFKSVFEIINNNYSDSSFDVEQFCSQMEMNQNTIYRKIKAVTGLSISELIRVERLKKAADMIKENRFTIQEVCFKVGFSSPAYFTQCFKKQYGVIPKEY